MIEDPDPAACVRPGAAQAIRDFIASYDARNANDRQIAARIRERLYSEQYRRERAHMEWLDLGGES